MQKTASGRIRVGALVVAISACGLASRTDAGSLRSPGCLTGGEAATVATVDDELNLHLVDGRVVRLAGIHADAGEPPGDSSPPQAALTSWLAGQEVEVAPLRAEPDRWGRVVAVVSARARSDARETVSVGEAVLDAGLAAAEPDPLLSDCWGAYLTLEAEARQAHVGLWAGRDVVLDPSDRPALARRLGSWTLVEGRIGQVRDSRARIYLRFSQDGGSGFALAIDHGAGRRLVRSLGPTESWVGRRVLARGLLDDRWGLQIDISAPEQISLAPP